MTPGQFNKILRPGFANRPRHPSLSQWAPLITSLLLTWCCGPFCWTVLPPGRLTADDRRRSLILHSFHTSYSLCLLIRDFWYIALEVSFSLFFGQLQLSLWMWIVRSSKENYDLYWTSGFFTFKLKFTGLHLYQFQLNENITFSYNYRLIMRLLYRDGITYSTMFDKKF